MKDKTWQHKAETSDDLSLETQGSRVSRRRNPEAGSCRGSENPRAGGRHPECRMAAETAHKTPGCPLGARDSWPAALTGAEGDACQPGTETKAAKPAASPRSRAHTQEDPVPTALREEIGPKVAGTKCAWVLGSRSCHH